MKIVVVVFSLFAFGIAYGSTSFVLPAPIEPGMETYAVLPFLYKCGGWFWCAVSEWVIIDILG